MKNVISRRSFLKAAGIIGASAALAACGGSSASTAGAPLALQLPVSPSPSPCPWSITSVHYYKGAQAIADSVNEATNGQFQIKVVAGGTLGGESDTLDMPFRATWTSQAAQTPCWQTTSPR